MEVRDRLGLEALKSDSVSDSESEPEPESGLTPGSNGFSTDEITFLIYW